MVCGNLPEIGFIELFHVKSFIAEWRNVQVSSRRVHFTYGLMQTDEIKPYFHFCEMPTNN